MKTTSPDWSDLALFAAVARAGDLKTAAASTGSSVATLSRRLRALEELLGKRLFLHGKSGYRLSPDGRALMEKTSGMEAAASEIGRWLNEGAGTVRVRISAGTWTSRRLAQNLAAFWSPEASWIPEFVMDDLDTDIARRETDIGIRNRRPDQPWLAGQRTATIRYAAYARDGSVAGWIAAGRTAARTPSARWVHEHHDGQIVTTTNDPRLALTLAKSGVGRVVLPDFVGDAEADLTRIGPEIDGLQSEEWLVSHHEGRHEPAVRQALNGLSRFLQGQKE